MRRLVSTTLIAVLAGALWPCYAKADIPDLTTAFAMRTFGRMPTDRASYALPAENASLGLAFHAPATISPAVSRSSVPALVEPVAYDRIFDLRDALQRIERFTPKTPALPHGTASAARFTLAGTSVVVPSYDSFGAVVRSDDIAPAFSSSLRDTATSSGASVRTGAFALAAQSARFDVTSIGAHDERLGTATLLTIGPNGHRVNVNVGSNYERLSTQAVPLFQYRPTAGAAPSIGDIPGYDSARLAGTFNDVTTLGVNAGVAVPLTHGFTLGVQYGTSRYTGAVGSTDFTPNFDTSKYSYSGALTFALPRSSSAIVVSAKQFRYQDNLNVVPTTYQTRADVNFTVKF